MLRTERILCCVVAVACLAMTPSAQLVADFTATPLSGPNPLAVAFADASTGGALSWTWSFGDGGHSVAKDPTHVYVTPGTYTVSLTVFGPGGVFDVETKTDLVTVDPATLDVDFVASDTQGLVSLQVAFTNTTSSSAPVDSWLWLFGDGASSTATHPVHDYTGPGSYTVSLTATIGGQQATHVEADFIVVDAAFLGPTYVSLASPGVSDIASADLDRDGDVEIATVTYAMPELVIYENLDGAGTYGPGMLFHGDDGYTSLRGLFLADLDGDAYPDLGVTDFRQLLWYPGDVGFQTEVEVDEYHFDADYRQMAPGDIDGDGAVDIVSLDLANRVIAWHRNTDGLGTFAPPSVIASSISLGNVVHLLDVDGDGDLDVVTGETVPSWSENLDGAGTFGPRTALSTTSIVTPNEIADSDLDGDGDRDLLFADFVQGLWVLSNDGSGTFAASLVDDSEPWQSVAVGDIDRDGDDDVVVASGKVAWFDNVRGDLQPAVQPWISELDESYREVRLIDVDGDGDLDVVASGLATGRIAWWENVLEPSPWRTLGGGAYGVSGVPALTAHGTLEPGAPLGLAVDDGPADALVLAWLSFSSTPLAVLGGTLHANPPTAQLLRVTDAAGAWSQSITWPAGVSSGVEFWLQFIVQDASVPAGLTLTNGLTATTP